MARDIGEIDKKLKVEKRIQETDVKFYDARKAPFKIYGLCDATGSAPFRRLPFELAENVNYQVSVLAGNTSGGRVRFRTNSEYVAIRAIMPDVTHFPHMTLTGSSGFDLYINKDGKSVYHRSFTPPIDMTTGYEGITHFGSREERDIIINFPLYNNLSELHIGVEKTSSVSEGDKYRYETPILFYGSSITQGGCASRPGNSYQAIISRRFDTDIINFGFSSGGCGEENIMEYMAQLDFSIFVMDYDYNAPSVEHLAETHPRAYNIIRKHKPDVPIIFMTKPDIELHNPSDLARRNIVFATYTKALKNNDKNVYFIDGYSLFGGAGRDSCTVDGAHPNDLGFWRMADAVGSVIEQILVKY